MNVRVRVCHAYTLDILAIEQHFEINAMQGKARQTKPSQAKTVETMENGSLIRWRYIQEHQLRNQQLSCWY